MQSTNTVSITVPIDRYRFAVDQAGRPAINPPETVEDARDPVGREHLRDVVCHNLDRVDGYASALRGMDNQGVDQNPEPGLVVVTGNPDLSPGMPADAALRYDPETGEVRQLDVRRSDQREPLLRYDSWGGLQELQFDWNGKRHALVSDGQTMTVSCWTIF